MDQNVLAYREVDGIPARDCLGCRGFGSDAPNDRSAHDPACALAPLQCARWQLALTTELAEPAIMELLPVLDASRQVVDFEWSVANHMAAHLLTGRDDDLTGRRLRDVVEDHPDARTLFDAYRNVAAHLMDSAVVVQRSGGRVRHVLVHRVSATDEGLAIVLSSPSAMSRQTLCAQALKALEADVALVKGKIQVDVVAGQPRLPR